MLPSKCSSRLATFALFCSSWQVRMLSASSPASQTFMPDEAAPHKRTWMIFGAQRSIWGGKLLGRVRSDLCKVATNIAKFEDVKMLVRPDERKIAEGACGSGVELVTAQMDDIWARDSGPVFVSDSTGAPSAISFNFNGWGGKQKHAKDAVVASVIADQAMVSLMSQPLVMEGGGIEVDGDGTAIITESCVLNANRNPGMTKEQAEKILSSLLGLSKIIWLPGIAGEDITDGHTDFYARFVRPGVVVAHFDPDPQSFDNAVTKQHLSILRGATDAKMRSLEVHVLTAPSFDRIRWRGSDEDFAAGYVNFYVCNGAVIMPEFGDSDADAAAADTLQRLFPSREIVALDIDGIAAGGGGIHCATQQEPQVQAAATLV